MDTSTCLYPWDCIWSLLTIDSAVCSVRPPPGPRCPVHHNVLHHQRISVEVLCTEIQHSTAHLTNTAHSIYHRSSFGKKSELIIFTVGNHRFIRCCHTVKQWWPCEAATLTSALLSAFFKSCSSISALLFGQRPWEPAAWWLLAYKGRTQQ